MSDDRGSFLNDRCKLSGRKPVIDIIGDPGLQVACRGAPEFSAAIDKGFLDPANFGDVGVDGNLCAIGQEKGEFGVGITFKKSFEFRCFHNFYGRSTACRSAKFVMHVHHHLGSAVGWNAI